MTTTWRLLEDHPKSGPWNMAVDEALLALYPETRQPTLRLYRWREPTLSLGYFQPLEDVDLDNCSTNNISVVRRPTGGRAVLHHHEWTYSVVVGLDVVPGGVTASYRAISQALVAAFESLGLEPIWQRAHTRGESAACFDTPAFAELTLGGKKVCGSAQTRTKHALLQHGSVPVRFPWRELAIALRLSERHLRALKRQAAGLDAFAPITLNDVRTALVEGFTKTFETLTPGELTSEERALARTLAKTKYARPDWRRKEVLDAARG